MSSAKTRSRRLIAGIYSGDQGKAAQAFKKIKSTSLDASLWTQPDGARLGLGDEGRAILRLDGEAVVAVRARPDQIHEAVQLLQSVGTPAVFVLPPVLSQPLAPKADEERARAIHLRLRESEAILESARQELLEAVQLEHSLSPSAEWLLDNAHVVRTQITEIRRDLPRRSGLRANSSDARQYTDIQNLARQLLKQNDHIVQAGELLNSLQRLQETRPLSIAELWSVPLMVRISLIEALAGLARRVSQAQQIREAAFFWANRLIASARRGSETLDRSMVRMQENPLASEPYFITCLAEQLQDEEGALARIQSWVERKPGPSLSELVHAEHNREAAECISIANIFGSLRNLSRIDFPSIFEAASLVEAELHKDPGNVYPNSDFATRDRCRKVVERLGRNNAVEEIAIAQRAVAMAGRASNPREGHVAWYLLSDGIINIEKEIGARVPFRLAVTRAVRRHATLVNIGGVTLLTLCFLTLTLATAWEMSIRSIGMLVAVGILVLFPLSELALQIVNALIVSLLPPCVLPRMDFEKGIPAECATLVVVPMMLVSREVVARELDKLEVRFLANRERSVYFALFSDFLDAPAATMAGDTAVLQVAREGIERLNLRYPDGRFLLFHRSRVWSESEQLWIGKERKRGKLEELNAWLNGEGSLELLLSGTLEVPIRYVITLDADTQLPPNTGRSLIETIAHPLNQVDLNPVTKAWARGYSIIQPRVSIALPGATVTRFTRVFADASGTDPYCKSVSDAQQDLFGHAIYHGKAIYDVRAFHASLHRRFPPETLLSHDLIEGAYVGVGLATDIELFETMPVDYGSFSHRQHRWTRGDWQIAAWIGRRVPASDGTRAKNPLRFIDRWRIFDNLRRSLVPVASVMLLLLGWLISAAPGVWSLVLALALIIPVLAPLLDRLARRLQGTIRGWQGAADEFVRALVLLAFLPHQAWLSADAIARVEFRRWISRRRLLEWHTAERAHSDSRRHMSSAMQQLLIVSGFSTLLFVLLWGRGALLPTAPFLALWIASPAIMRWLAQPIRPATRHRLTLRHSLYLRRISRRTWRYFDDLVGEGTSWLPPDNSQLSLNVEIAQRTSPTNIGLWLTSLLAARDLGYVTVDDLRHRCSGTLATMQRMEKYEGHLLNWYDIRSLSPLVPRYVSTVDSGNLLASLWVLKRGIDEVIQAPIAGVALLRGLSDTLSILRSVCGRDPSAVVPLQALRRILRGKVSGHALAGKLRLAAVPIQQLRDLRWVLATPGDERSYWVGRLATQMESCINTLDRYLPWMEILIHPPDAFLRTMGEEFVDLRRRAVQTIPSLLTIAEGLPPAVETILSKRQSPDLRPEVGAWLEHLHAACERSRVNAREAVDRFRELAVTASQLADGINMRFLYDADRRLFGVGYAVGDPLVFTSHYDLLASECRVASLAAIARGDVPLNHWFALGRPRATSATGQTLLSWSGTMFEYMMPLLFTRTFANSLLDQACTDALQRQVDYGEAHGVPWGVSECAYSALDANQTYQYRAFGVPELALQHDLKDSVVVAPYATMLALPLNPLLAIENLRRLERMGMSGPMGFYESIDFTREAKRTGERGVKVYAYMSHHQGMTLIALNNVLHHGATARRFHDDLRIQAFESLLFERIPNTPSLLDESRTPSASVRVSPLEETVSRNWDEHTAFPRVHLQGNGAYSLMITNSGTGYSRWNGFDVTRWRADSTLDPWGSFVYVRDVRSGTVWATAPRPSGGNLGTSTVHFSADRAEFHRRVLGIDTDMHVTVAAEDNVELRRISVTNRSLRSRQIEFTSYVELALAPHAMDKAHTVFARMFIETECVESGVLFARRRQRAPDEPQIWAAHVLVGANVGIQFETDRVPFIGRGNRAEDPAALRRDLTGSAGDVLDPIFSLRCRVDLEPRERVELCFLTIAAASREELMALTAKYRRRESIARAFEMSWTRRQLEFRHLGIGPSAAQRFQELAGHLIYPGPALRASEDRLSRNTLGQTSLWAHGISGDLPMLTVTIADLRSLPLIRELLIAHSYWQVRGFQADLIILNQETPSYERPLNQQLERQIAAHTPPGGVDRPGGVFLRDWNSIPEDHRTLILSASSVVLSGTRGSLQQQLLRVTEGPGSPVPPLSGAPAERDLQPLPFMELACFNGLGGFTPGGVEYAIYLQSGSNTPLPWINVMANPNFGAVVSESGLGVTWQGNSQSHRLTPWHNDPLNDPPSEIIYIRDDENGQSWTPTARPIRDKQPYRVRHGQGYSVFEHNCCAIGQELTVFVPTGEDGSGDPIKVCRLRLRNDSERARRLSVTWFAEWVLGSQREDQQRHIQVTWDTEANALLAKQTWTGSGQIAFVTSIPAATSYSSDRAQFLGRNGSDARPAAIAAAHLDNHTGAGLDPAAALQCSVQLDPGATIEVVFLLGAAPEAGDARTIIARYKTVDQIDAAFNAVREFWNRTLGTIQVRTPSLAADLLLNRWLPYQVLSCRFWGRTALYQSGGAMGFRDQLQDSLALIYARPGLTRTHILDCAARQFVEGDVQHWWHIDTGNGVRTRCSDDLLWLPYATLRYIETTGDRAILHEQVSFIEGPLLADGEQDHLFIPQRSQQTASLWDHCGRAIERALTVGPHNLPLMGAGDWNDGLSRVGFEGRGESTWLAWFLCAILRDFAWLADTQQDIAAGTSQRWRDRAAELSRAMESAAWDGEWYLRGFFDDGTPLGSHTSSEASIDSLPQSWAVISGAANPERAKQALQSADRLLTDSKNGIVRLFTPPFDHSQPNPGYIMGYPPGVRENGGQYTHGSLWLAMAWAKMGRGDAAVRLLEIMNPVEKTLTADEVNRYQGEPYVMPADVYTAPHFVGRSGWTWYTGSAGWMYRIWLEEVLGFHLRGDVLSLQPSIPESWPGFEIDYRYRSTPYKIRVRNNAPVRTAELDGSRISDSGGIQLVDDGRTHEIVINLPATPAETVVAIPQIEIAR